MIRFVSMGGGAPMSSHHDIRVQVHHVLSEGYLPAYNGETIKEEIPIRDFLMRIFRDERHVENELYRVSKCLAGGHYYNNDEISRISHKYDAMYSEVIRKGKVVLPQHKVAWQPTLGGMGGIDPFNDQRAQMAQKSAMDYHRESMLREAAYFAPPPKRGFIDIGPSDRELATAQATLVKREIQEQKKKRDDDLFFLTT